MEELKRKVKKELENIGDKGLTASNLDTTYKLVDIMKDKSDLQLKRDSEAEVVREGDKLIVRAFYPMNLMQKLICFHMMFILILVK